MTQPRKFSEVLEEYVEACVEFREAEKEARELADNKMYFHVTDRYQTATEEKHRLSEELNLFFRTK